MGVRRQSPELLLVVVLVAGCSSVSGIFNGFVIYFPFFRAAIGLFDTAQPHFIGNGFARKAFIVGTKWIYLYTGIAGAGRFDGLC